MDENQSRPKPVDPEKRKSAFISKLEQWLGLKDDDGDLYQDTMRRLPRGKPANKE